MNHNREHWEQASKYLPGGVCSSARIHKGFDGPFYLSHSKGSKVYDLKGNEYVDLCTSFGSALVGHSHPKVIEAIHQALDMGLMCAYENEWHARLAQRIAEAVPCVEMLRFTLSGTETTYYAVKLTREYTGRPLVVKFEGHFHGFNDYLVTPDLCALGKAIGGGTPLSVFGGKRRIMEHVSPLGKAQHSGTYNGHLSSIMAGMAFFDVIDETGCYEDLLSRSQRLYDGIDEIMQRLGFVGRVQGLGARFSFLFGPPAEKKLLNYQDLMDNEWSLFHRFCRACLRHGVYVHTMWHHGISVMHTDNDIDRALEGIQAALRDVMAESQI